MIGKIAVIPAVALLMLIASGCGTPDTPARGQQPTTAVMPAASTAPTTPDGSAALPTVTATTQPLPDCGATMASSYQGVNTIEELAWMSHQAIVGTVVEQQPSVWGDSPNPLNSANRVIYTNYVVQVEQRLRGQPLDTVIVRQMGGTIGACVQVHESEPSLTVGDRLLLFLRDAQPPSSTLAYDLTGGPQGYWKVNTDGTVTIDVGQLHLYNGMPLVTLIGLVQAALAGPPPNSPLAPEYFVPIDQAPVPIATPGL